MSFGLLIIAAALFTGWLYHKAKQSNKRNQDRQPPPEPQLTFTASVLPDPVKQSEAAEPAPDVDAFETFNFYGAQVIPARGNYHIEYTDRRGLHTQRPIRIKRVLEYQGEYALEAHCLMRNSHRTFIEASIRNPLNTETGERIANVAQDAIAQYSQSDQGRVDALLSLQWECVVILEYVSRADGRLNKKERALIAQFLHTLPGSKEIPDELLDGKIKALPKHADHEFKDAVNMLAERKERQTLSQLHAFAQSIIATDKTESPFETAALNTIAEAVKKCRASV